MNNLGKLSLAIPRWVGTMSTSERRGVGPTQAHRANY